MYYIKLPKNQLNIYSISKSKQEAEGILGEISLTYKRNFKYCAF